MLYPCPLHPPLGGGTPVGQYGRRMLYRHPPLHPPLGGGTPVGPTVDTHQYRIINTAGDDKVGFIINPAIAFVAKSKSVQVPFRGERANFITGGAVIINTGHNTLCSKGPVVRSSSSSSHFVVVV